MKRFCAAITALPERPAPVSTLENPLPGPSRSNVESMSNIDAPDPQDDAQIETNQSIASDNEASSPGKDGYFECSFGYCDHDWHGTWRKEADPEATFSASQSQNPTSSDAGIIHTTMSNMSGTAGKNIGFFVTYTIIICGCLAVIDDDPERDSDSSLSSIGQLDGNDSPASLDDESDVEQGIINMPNYLDYDNDARDMEELRQFITDTEVVPDT